MVSNRTIGSEFTATAEPDSIVDDVRDGTVRTFNYVSSKFDSFTDQHKNTATMDVLAGLGALGLAAMTVKPFFNNVMSEHPFIGGSLKYLAMGLTVLTGIQWSRNGFDLDKLDDSFGQVFDGIQNIFNVESGAKEPGAEELVQTHELPGPQDDAPPPPDAPPPDAMRP